MGKLVPDVGPADRAAEALDRYLAHAVPFGFSGALLLATSDEIRLARGYGWADRDARRLNRSSTVFSLGSITKPVTAAVVLALVDQGRIGLRDRLADRLGSVPDDKATITVEQVLSHSAGLPDATGEDFDPGERADVIQEIFATPLRFEPGTAYVYSNTGYSVLAAVIEQVTGEPYEAAVRRLVLEPAGMTHTGYRLPDWDRSELAHFHVGDSDVGVHLDKVFPSWHIMGNGEMLSTVRDLHRFTRALRPGVLLEAPTLEDAWRPRHSGYGLGWSISDGPRGRIVQHDGASTNGVSALLRWYQDSDTVIALLCNRDYSGGFLGRAVAPQVEALAFGADTPMPPEVPSPPIPIESDLAGDYLTDDGARATIRRTPDGHAVTFSGQALLDLASGAPSAPEQEERNRRTLEVMRALLAGDDEPLLTKLDGDRARLDRLRPFITDRLGTDPSAVVLEGSMPAEISIGPVTAVQLALPGTDIEHTMRVFWHGLRFAGLGYGTRPLLDLPLVPIAARRFIVHHLALGTTTEVRLKGAGSDRRITFRGPRGTMVHARSAR